ncbi:zinc ribbon domain-containing protein [Shimwellia blattae]|uniref:Zinc ribbon domain-containing protein n=1 Tax=Shimwellia blattae (strain ATCC 29907 / DSM 4481 / JCM 1650 / NBRC 105725 / CDC 9005-74) TaxID=630626 RepID=I2B9C8_SHIBC|nr:zinc ribbon domain-containing protein [Shimwellia blattae]AFJ47132.1 hypothetical protein EBL_c20410 [Shimwellia blattae DSM 4481 = NBRC 105725]VDY64625.1 Uncharacterised protein [Shimwellia blattae]VEC22732.1 Uncharacterised protein [Shimwellia blattae]
MIKTISILIISISIIALIYSLNMDVTVYTALGRSVNNIGLIAQRQIFIIVGCTLLIIGVLAYIAAIFIGNSYRGVEICPACVEKVKATAVVCKHCGHNLDKSRRQVLIHGVDVLNIIDRNGDVNTENLDALSRLMLDGMAEHTPLAILVSYHPELEKIKSVHGIEYSNRFEYLIEKNIARLKGGKSGNNH